MSAENSPLLEVRDLRVHFPLDEGTVRAVDGLSYSLARGRTLGVVGESGCGKTVTAQSILGIVPRPGRIVSGEIIYHPSSGAPIDLARLDPFGPRIRAIRGKEIAYIFQEPLAALSPVHTIGHQMIERIRLHLRLGKDEARAQAVEMLARVGMPRPGQIIDRYAHQLECRNLFQHCHQCEQWHCQGSAGQHRCNHPPAPAGREEKEVSKEAKSGDHQCQRQRQAYCSTDCAHTRSPTIQW